LLPLIPGLGGWEIFLAVAALATSLGSWVKDRGCSTKVTKPAA